jgi:hypothetical protein
MSAILGVISLPGSGSIKWLLPIMPLCILALTFGRMACIRLCVDNTGFEYRDILGKSFRLKYSEVRAVTTKTISLGRGQYYQSTFHLHDGRRVRANLFPFGQEVYRLLRDRIGGT